jgi:DNA repair photolyase
MKNPIYVPSGRAGEYGEYALNIYTGCPHRCYYCYAPSVLHMDRETFHSNVRPRDGIVEAVQKQLAGGGIRGQTIHLCFTCDPYPNGYDTTATREIIQLIKASGNHVQLLTKSAETRDLDLLDKGDWYGISYSGYPDDLGNPGIYKTSKHEPGASMPCDRMAALVKAYGHASIWISFEPVLNVEDVLWMLQHVSEETRVKIGKLNYHVSNIDWQAFGWQAEEICRTRGLDYTIKDDLRAEMERKA